MESAKSLYATIDAIISIRRNGIITRPAVAFTEPANLVTTTDIDTGPSADTAIQALGTG
jgi:hypothetical protein